MKILQLCTKVPFPMKDGGAAGIFVFSKTFGELGNEVVILAVNPPKHYIEQHQYNSLPANISIVPVFINTNPSLIHAIWNILFSSLSYHIVRFYHKDYAKKLKAILLEFQPDIVQIEGIYMGMYIDLIRKYSQSGIVLREHNVEHQLWNEIAEEESFFLKRYYLGYQAKRMKRNELIFIKKSNLVTFVTKEDMNVIRNIVPQINGKVIPFGLNVKELVPIKSTLRNGIYYLGALDWIPNQNALKWFITSVWPAVRIHFPELILHIAGRNAPSNLAVLFQQIEGVKFYGEVEDASMFASPFSVMIVPLFSGSGVRVKIIEAMEQGKVVIGSTKAVSGIPAVNGIHLITADEPMEYVEQIKQLYSDENKMRIISHAARKFVLDYYDITKIVKELIGDYHELVV